MPTKNDAKKDDAKEDALKRVLAYMQASRNQSTIYFTPATMAQDLDIPSSVVLSALKSLKRTGQAGCARDGWGWFLITVD